MSARALARLALAVLVFGCRPAPEAEPPRTAAPGRPTAPSRLARGEQVEANVPLASGDVLALADLRGKIVVLELSDASHRNPDVLADYTRLLASAGDRLAIIVVSLDANGWDTSSAAYQLGWDPAGALAAKLNVAALPTVLVLDREGRVAYQYSGKQGAHAEALAKLDELLR